MYKNIIRQSGSSLDRLLVLSLFVKSYYNINKNDTIVQ